LDLVQRGKDYVNGIGAHKGGQDDYASLGLKKTEGIENDEEEEPVDADGDGERLKDDTEM